MLDNNVLSRVIHPRKHADERAWFARLLAMGEHDVLLSEIVDYETRRKLYHLRAHRSVEALDRLPSVARYVPLDPPTMRLAAQLWATLRLSGAPGAAEEDIDVDVILAAQALREGATVVTTNAKHLSRIVAVARWEDL